MGMGGSEFVVCMVGMPAQVFGSDISVNRRGKHVICGSRSEVEDCVVDSARDVVGIKVKTNNISRA